MTTSPPIPLPGCRHDVLGHALKAIGVLRAISACAAPEDCDPGAEGWWNSDSASFMIRSSRYPDAESLVKFFAEKYRPTPILAPWHKTGGITDNIEVVISSNAGDVEKFRRDNEALLESLGLKTTKKLSPSGGLVFALKPGADLSSVERIITGAGLSCRKKQKKQGRKQITEVTITPDRSPLEDMLSQHRDRLAEFGLTAKKGLSADGLLKFASKSSNRDAIVRLVEEFNRADSPPLSPDSPEAARDRLRIVTCQKESGKTDGAVPRAAALLRNDPVFQDCLRLARDAVSGLQGGEEEVKSDAFFRYRDQLPDSVAESVDSLYSLFLVKENDNPLFLSRGRPGDKVRGHIFASYWEYFEFFRRHSAAFARTSLFAEKVTASGVSKKYQQGKGTPFFPDAIKSYNQGTDWVTEDFPFCPLDYLLAVEGALAMRGATSKTLSARSRTRAAFPFIFEGTETMTDEQGKSLRLATSFWLPIWTQPTTFGELQSFILDCQARLPAKDCRFSSDFARAIRAQGVDAGFFAFQEFQFKLKGANVPWTTAGRFVPCSGTATASVLNELLAPVDASGFLDQFEFNRERKADLHALRAPILDAIETAAAEPDAPKILDVLSGLATLNSQLARSKSLREKVGGGRVAFVPPLRCDDWSAALQGLEGDPEFDIARALASIRGQEKQPDGTYSEVEPFQGSLVPLRRKQNGWYLPDPPSAQAVWTGIDLARDLAAVLARRVLDSAKDVRPAIVGNCTVRLPTILRFLRGELDDRRIAKLLDALSLIDWRFQPGRPDRGAGAASADERLDPVPVAYAAARSLIEIACESKSTDDSVTTDRSGPRTVVQRTIALVSRQEPVMAASATAEGLRRLAIVGVPNPYGEESQRERPRLAGRDVIQVDKSLVVDFELARRLAAAILIPLDWRDRWTLFRAITLPQTTS